MATIFKRIEIWALLILVGLATWWALRADPDPISSGYSKNGTSENSTHAGGNGGEGMLNPENQSLLELKEILYSPDPEKGENGLLEVTILGRSGTEDAVSLTEENVEMLTSEGEKIHRFFAPFSNDPKLQAHESSLVTLKYWVNKPVDVLWLTYRDQTIKVVLPSA